MTCEGEEVEDAFHRSVQMLCGFEEQERLTTELWSWRDFSSVLRRLLSESCARLHILEDDNKSLRIRLSHEQAEIKALRLSEEIRCCREKANEREMLTTISQLQHEIESQKKLFSETLKDQEKKHDEHIECIQTMYAQQLLQNCSAVLLTDAVPPSCPQIASSNATSIVSYFKVRHGSTTWQTCRGEISGHSMRLFLEGSHDPLSYSLYLLSRVHFGVEGPLLTVEMKFSGETASAVCGFGSRADRARWVAAARKVGVCRPLRERTSLQSSREAHDEYLQEVHRVRDFVKSLLSGS